MVEDDEDDDLNDDQADRRRRRAGAVDTDESENEIEDNKPAEKDKDESKNEQEDKSEVKEAREDGDGQEAIDEDKALVDEDEDRRNPQYIPKKGMFYEHDDRIDSEDEKKVDEKEEPRKKRVWKSETINRWGHDKFAELDQAPKSKEELVQAYGYDIRNEDNAPRARRRRRYGRGPNKYTRDWKDEDAYGGPAGKEGRGSRGIVDPLSR